MQMHLALPLPCRWIQRDNASAGTYDVAPPLSRNDNDDEDDDRRGVIIPTDDSDDSDAVRRGYDNCGKVVAGAIALAGEVDVPVVEEGEEATARGGETKSVEARTDMLMLPRWT
jgi:hypothetical protein